MCLFSALFGVEFDLFTKPSGSVSVTSGAFSDLKTDLVVNCAEPIEISRWYVSSCKDGGHRGHWVLQTEGIKARVSGDRRNLDITWNSDKGGSCHFIAQRDWSFRRHPEGWAARVEIPDSYTNIGGSVLSASNNLRGLSLWFHYGGYGWTLTQGNGEQRIFGHYGKRIHQNRHHCDGEETFRLIEVRKPNGNRLYYSYNEGNNLTRIESTNADGSVTFGWVEFDYGQSNQVLVQTSDGQSCRYVYKIQLLERGKKCDKIDLLDEVHHPDGRIEKLGYYGRGGGLPPLSLSGVLEDEEHHHGIDYYRKGRVWVAGSVVEVCKNKEHDLRLGRVRCELRPVGSDATLHRAVQYIYGKDLGWTDVYDSYYHRTRYSQGSDKRLDQITRYSGGKANRSEQFEWWKGGDLCCRRIVDANQSTLLSHRYEYDQRGNVVREKLRGNLTGEGEGESCRSLSYSGNRFNLVARDETETRAEVYTHQPGTNLVISKLVYADGHLQERTFFTYDHNAQKVLAIEDDGCDEDPQSLAGVTYRRITATENRADGLLEWSEERYLEGGVEHLLRRTHLFYDASNQVVREEVFDGDGQFSYAIDRAYDRAGRVISESNPLGQETQATYDINGNLIEQWRPLSTGRSRHSYDFSDRLIRTEMNDLSVQYRYDLLGQVVEEIDTCGNSTRYVYDTFGNLIEEIQPAIRTPDGWEAPVIRRSYDALDRMIEEVDSRGSTTRREYNVRGDLTATHFPDGTTQRFTYDIAGRLIRETARNGAITHYTRDYRDRLLNTDVYSSEGEHLVHREIRYKGELKVAEIDGNGVETLFKYDGAGRFVEEVRADTRRTYFYDPLGRQASEREYYGDGDDDYTATVWEYDLLDRMVRQEVVDSSRNPISRVDYAYDADGNRIREVRWSTETEVNVSTATYDFMGNPTSTTNPLDQTTTSRYDRNARFEDHPLLLVTLIDPVGNQTLSYRDPRGNTLCQKRLNPIGQLLAQTDTFYDLSGNRVSEVHRVMAPNHPERIVENHWEYDSSGHLRMQTEATGTPSVRVTRFHYNADGDLCELQRPDGTTLTYTYDPLGRISHRTGPHLDDRYTYDPNDNIIAVYSLSGTTTRSYDNNNRLISETLGNGLRLGYRYDCQGRRTRLILPDHSSVAYTFDAGHLRTVTRLTSEQTPLYTHHYISYDLDGNKLLEQLPGSAGTRTTTYDPLGRITAITTSPFSQSDLTYDPAGNLTHYTLDQRRDFVPAIDFDGNPTTFSTRDTLDANFTYDDLQQLTSEDGVASHTYTHDSLHNRIVQDDQPWTVDPLNQLTSTHNETLTYDPQGCLTSRPNTTYTYDALNRLITVETPTHRATYTYDIFDRRLSKQIHIRQVDTWHLSTHHRYLFDNRMEIGAVDANDSLLEFRALGIGHGAEIGAAISIELSSTPYIPIHDHRGSVTTLLDLSGHTQTTYRYTAYGQCQTQDTANPYRFCSKRHDPETHLTNFGRRYYDPSLGRWLTPDPKGYEESSNLYVYCLNAPLSRLDLWGELSFTFSIQPPPRYGTPSSNFSRATTTLTGAIIEFIGVHLLDSGRLKEWVVRQGCILQGKPFDPSDHYCFEKPSSGRVGHAADSSKLRHRYVNGMLNSSEVARETAEQFSIESLSTGCYYTHLPCHGFFPQLMEVLGMWLGFRSSDAVDHLVNDILNDFSQLDADGMLMLYAHSAGTLITRAALKKIPDELRQRIEVYAYGGPDWIGRSAAGKVCNYCYRNDPVALGSLLKHPCGPSSSGYNVREIRPRRRGSGWAHSIRGDQYKKAMARDAQYAEKRYLG